MASTLDKDQKYPYTKKLSRNTSEIATQADVLEEVNKVAGSLATVSQADSTAVDVAGIVADFNTLLANLRTAGVLAT